MTVCRACVTAAEMHREIVTEWNPREWSLCCAFFFWQQHSCSESIEPFSRLQLHSVRVHSNAIQGWSSKWHSNSNTFSEKLNHASLGRAGHVDGEGEVHLRMMALQDDTWNNGIESNETVNHLPETVERSDVVELRLRRRKWVEAAVKV